MLALDKFLSLLERSQLLEADRLSELIADWKSQATLRQMDDARDCAEHLVANGAITQWQCRKLLEGRYRGFFLGRYKLLDHLGSGGMSSVYLAEHVLMRRRVAIKVLPQNRVSDSSYLAQFHLEGQAAAALDHRNIVRAYDLDNEGRIHYLVMEYVEGRDLHALVSQDGPLDYATAAHCIAEAAAGLDHAHHCGLVHRDIKPANLLVDAKGTVKILDMGLAKFTPGTRPAPGFAREEQVLGTADYLAPEQAVNSQTVDHRGDIYSLGCTLYYLLTGHPPFAEGTALERMTAHQQQIPPSITLERPDAPPELLAICRRMMEKSPENRYQSSAEVEEALLAWLESQVAAGKARHGAFFAPRVLERARERSRSAGSSANLVSGSQSDLHRAADVPPLTESLQDTDPNLHRATTKIPSPSDKARNEPTQPAPGESQVLAPPIVQAATLERPAAQPPIQPPAISSLAPLGNVPLQPPQVSQTTIVESADSLLATRAHGEALALVRQARRAQRGHVWWWLIMFAGIVFVAIAWLFGAAGR